MSIKKEVSEVAKKRYIKNNISILSHDSKVDIYKMIKLENDNAIRDSRNVDGLYIDLDKITEKHILDNIYDIIKRRKECIRRK
jgi:hypothetical protein